MSSNSPTCVSVSVHAAPPRQLSRVARKRGEPEPDPQKDTPQELVIPMETSQWSIRELKQAINKEFSKRAQNDPNNPLGPNFLGLPLELLQLHPFYPTTTGMNDDCIFTTEDNPKMFLFIRLEEGFLFVLIHLLASHRSNLPWKVNEPAWQKFEPNWTIGDLKRNLDMVPINEQHFYRKKIALALAEDEEELTDDIKISSLVEQELSLIIKSSDFSLLDYEGLCERLPHIGHEGEYGLLERLREIPEDQLDSDSVREGPPQKFETIDTVRIFNRNSGKFQEYIEVDGEKLYPYHYMPVPGGSNLVEFRGRFSYEYSIASEEYVKEVELANIKYEADLFECKKKLYDLPIALKASEAKLAEVSKAAREKTDTDVESVTSTLGKLVLEQSAMRAELDEQHARLPQLKPIVLDRSKFTRHRFQSSIKLEFGFHKLDYQLYEILYVHAKRSVTSIELPVETQPIPKEPIAKREGECAVDSKKNNADDDDDDDGKQPRKDEDGEVIEASEGIESPTKAV